MKKIFLAYMSVLSVLLCCSPTKIKAINIEKSDLYEAVEKGLLAEVQKIVDSTNRGIIQINQQDRAAALEKAEQLSEKLASMLTQCDKPFSLEDLAPLGITMSNITQKNIQEAADKLQNIVESIKTIS